MSNVGAPREHKAVIGKRSRMNVKPDGAGFTLLETQLISARVDKPRQFCVSIMPPVKASGDLPYNAPVDGTALYVPGTGLSAPFLPDLTAALQLYMRWGAGGVAYQTRFDYPAHGVIFAVTFDTMDLRAVVRGEQSVLYATEDDVPNVGAFMVEGVPADPTPLAWQEAPGALALVGDSLFWSVKPYARRLRVSAPGSTRITVTFLDTQGAVVFQESAVPVAAGGTPVADVPVPVAATVVQVTNNAGAAATAFLEWRIGFA